MIKKVLATVTVASFVTVSGASWAQVGVGGNSVAKYPTVEASKNKKVVNHGVGGNSAPSYSATEASKNKTGLEARRRRQRSAELPESRNALSPGLPRPALPA